MIRKFVVNRKYEFVSGLHWQPLNSLTLRDARKESAKLGKQLSYDLAVWRIDGAMQVGMGARADGYSEGAYSAAAVVSKSLANVDGIKDFLSAIRLPDGRYLYVAQSNGIILPDGDFVDVAEKVKRRLLSDLALGKTWGTVICPAEWNIDGSVERQFLELIPRRGKRFVYRSWWKLVPIKTDFKSAIKKYGLIAAAVLAAGVAYYLYTDYQEQLRTQAAARALAESMNNKPPPPPWKTSPDISTATASCLKGLGQVTTFWPGNWKLESVVCNIAERSLTIQWSGGAFAWVDHIRSVYPDVVLSADLAKASMVFPLTELDSFANEEPVAEKLVLDPLVAKLQTLGVRINYAAHVATAAEPPSQAVSAPGVKKFAWSIKEMPLSPSSMVELLLLPGMRLEKIQLADNKGVQSWSYEGVLYVQGQ